MCRSSSQWRATTALSKRGGTSPIAPHAAIRKSARASTVKSAGGSAFPETGGADAASDTGSAEAGAAGNGASGGEADRVSGKHDGDLWRVAREGNALQAPSAASGAAPLPGSPRPVLAIGGGERCRGAQ